MDPRFLAFDKSLRLEVVVLVVCAVKLGITLTILVQKIGEMTLLQVLEFANSTLTDWMWTIIMVYLGFHYIAYGPRGTPQARRRHYASSTSSRSSRSSLRSVSSFGSTRSSDSGSSIDSIISQESIDSIISEHSDGSIRSRISQRTSTTIVRHRTHIPNVMMDRFMALDDRQFEADMGRMQGMYILDSVTDMYLRRGTPSGAGYRR
ncbi:hypothetical protein TWF481_008722 [Arthrobotrys musiformis]|uniref:Uncharacterized protein n=1 Tax=Arthrobotrys musiformis TaxID=47236 RepID=A0AAV9W807_9PEZI